MMDENPYLGVVSRKLRNLKKRLTRVEEIEALVSQGKPLDDSQLNALAGKGAVIENIGNLQQVMTAMQEIAASESAQKKDGTHSKKKVAEVEKEAKAMEASLEGEVKGPELGDIQERTRMVVALLHVCESYSVKTQKPLPAEVEYFYSVVLGKASVNDFTTTLEQSLKSIGLFMFPEKASGIHVLGGMTYDQLQTQVRQLAGELGWHPDDPPLHPPPATPAAAGAGAGGAAETDGAPKLPESENRKEHEHEDDASAPQGQGQGQGQDVEQRKHSRGGRRAKQKGQEQGKGKEAPAVESKHNSEDVHEEPPVVKVKGRASAGEGAGQPSLSPSPSPEGEDEDEDEGEGEGEKKRRKRGVRAGRNNRGGGRRNGGDDVPTAAPPPLPPASAPAPGPPEKGRKAGEKGEMKQKQKEAGGETGVLGRSATKHASAKKKKTATASPGGAGAARGRQGLQETGDRGKAGLSETKEG